MLIDCSYFTKGSRHILNASMGSMPNPNAEEAIEAIESFIAENQETYLIRILGSVVGRRVNNYLVCLDEDEEPRHNEKFDKLCDCLRESFAYYVFFHILRAVNTQATITGLVILKSANTHVSPLRRQVIAWNSMVDKNRIFAEWTQSSDCPVSGIIISDAMLTKINSLNL